MTNVIDLSKRLALHDAVPPLLATLRAAPTVVEVLEDALPHVTKDQQCALIAVLAWRIMGAPFPAQIELLKRMPSLKHLHEESVQAAFAQLCDAGTLVYQSRDEEGIFIWPALEQVINLAIADMNAPRIITPDGVR